MYEELARMQHHGREDMAEELSQHLRCWGCEKELSDREMREYGNLCKTCEAKRVGEELGI
jgi:hypothetical protein